MTSDFAYKEYIPENCESIVDYTQPPQDRVKFHYPKDRTFKQAVWHSGLNTFGKFWFIVGLIPSIWLLIGGLLIYLSGVFIANPMAERIVYYYLINPMPSPINVATYNPSVILPLTALFFLGYWIVGIPIVAVYLASRNKELLSSMIPKMNAKMSKYQRYMRRKVVETKDIFENKYVIPLFANVYLDWKTTGDFGVNLEKVEVLAIPNDWEWVDRKRKTPLPNESIFRAVFYFREVPKEGNMEIIFD